MTTHEPLACPWCAHETSDGNDFRTHLMVEHRKSDLAAFVLESLRSAAPLEHAADDEPDDRQSDDSTDDDSGVELDAELLAR